MKGKSKRKSKKEREVKVNMDELVRSDSEDSESNKILLDKHRKKMNKKNDEDEEEVYKFDDSDVEENDDDDLPDIRAWGQQKKSYYNADYVDQDYGGLAANEEEYAAMEEAEATAIQNRLTEELKDSDFSLDIFTSDKPQQKSVKQKKESKKEKKSAEDVVKRNLELLTKRQKLELLNQESPELMGLLQDGEKYLEKMSTQVNPCLELIKSKFLPDGLASECINVYAELISNYLCNLSFYLLLKAKRISITAHPVIGRLVQCKKLLKELEGNVPDDFWSTVDEILALSPEEIPTMIDMGKLDEFKSGEIGKKNILEMDNEMAVANEDGEEMNEDELRRGITYQIAKNKGLTPYRKKELRNPRVKHKLKYRKAKIRRKGQVREARYELSKYGGEISGIKIGVAKGVKIK